MLNLNTVTTVPLSYAQIKNSRFNDVASNIVTISQRWVDTLKNLPFLKQSTVDYSLESAIEEFKRRNPNLKSWQDVLDLLPDSKLIQMRCAFIDTTMQRLLKQLWCTEILHNFNPIKAVPIQVYRPDPEKEVYVAWDGQHTLASWWLIATQIFELDPEKDDILIPVNVYKAHLKSVMRDSFIGHNGGDYKELLDLFDKIEQMILGCRIDNSQNPEWIEMEAKQTILEKYDLFLTKKGAGDEREPGAITRMPEFVKTNKETLEHVFQYLVAAGCNSRPVDEKEMMLMTYFFERCKSEKIKVTKRFIFDIAMIINRRYNSDLSDHSVFWNKAQTAYRNWHNQNVFGVVARFNKEAVHGYPFLVSQLMKDLPQHQFPVPNTNSNFIPSQEDLS